ncbi:unnamed protein product, partial [Candidula unifasciata]
HFPLLNESPVLNGPSIQPNGSFNFICQVIYNGNDPDQVFEVVWTFNGQAHPSVPSQLLFDSERIASLDISLLNSLVDTQVGCQVRLVYPGSDVKTRFINSNTYFAGIQISPDPLEISEIDFEKNMTVTSTIPILCDHDLECCLIFTLNVNKTAVVPKRNILLQGSRNVLLALDVIPSSNSGTYLRIFEDYKPKSIQVTIKDETAYRCSMTGDPHITGFDFKFMYDLYKSGDFVAYEAPARDFMIQIRTVPCGGGSVACICGIAVRERNDVIYLPSGSEVKIEAGGTNVYISIPAFDKGQGRGICGTNDGVEDNDFTHPDGTVEPACTQRCIPDAFFESWRVTGNNSLFEVVPDPVNDTESTNGSFGRYCSCLDNTNGTATVSCSAREHVQTANTAVRHFRKLVNPNKQWPNDQGITEAQARDMCTKAIQKSPLYSQCQNFQRLIDSVISDCLADILHGGTTAFLDDVTASFTSQCQLTLAQNPDSYVTNTDGQQVIKPGVIDICPVECLKHGQCADKGQCICQNGWEGETCLIESGKGPQLIAVKSGELCDISQMKCDIINIDVTNIIFGNPLTCRIQAIDVIPSTQRYNISATKDGLIFGNDVSLRVFDGTCLDCDRSGCKVKITACHINNICYKDGDIDKFSENRTCDVTKSNSQWTIIRSEQGELTTSPVLTGPILHANKSFVFQCEVIYSNTDDSQEIEVAWTFNGQQNPASPPLVIKGSNRTIVLDGRHLQGHLGTKVGCQARLVYSESNVSTTFVASSSYFAGIQ